MTQTDTDATDGIDLNRERDDAARIADALETQAHTQADLPRGIADALDRIHDTNDKDSLAPVQRDVKQLDDALDAQGHSLAGDVWALLNSLEKIAWEWGDPCPDCGSMEFVRKETVAEVVRPEGEGGMEHVRVISEGGQRIECAECWLTLEE